MRKAYTRILRRKTKKFFKVSFEIITGWQPLDEKKIRQENIDYIFKHTIHWMPDVIKEYDSFFDLFKNQDSAFNATFQKLSA